MSKVQIVVKMIVAQNATWVPSTRRKIFFGDVRMRAVALPGHQRYAAAQAADVTDVGVGSSAIGCSIITTAFLQASLYWFQMFLVELAKVQI